MRPQKFYLVLLIKILSGNKTFPFVLIYPFDIMGFYLKRKLSKSIIGFVYSFYKTILYQWILLQDLFSQSFILLEIISLEFEVSVALQPFDKYL